MVRVTLVGVLTNGRMTPRMTGWPPSCAMCSPMLVQSFHVSPLRSLTKDAFSAYFRASAFVARPASSIDAWSALATWSATSESLSCPALTKSTASREAVALILAR